MGTFFDELRHPPLAVAENRMRGERFEFDFERRIYRMGREG